jgi:putative transposase
MLFEKENLYHIYNQGNNRQKIFFNKENYLFFLTKIQIYILPYADILAWCLMPNHFHLMVHVNEVELEIIEGLTQSQTFNNLPSSTQSQALNNQSANKMRSFNDSIGIMLRSYTRAINKQNGTTGSLFRKETKAECLKEIKGITPSFYNTQAGTIILVDNPEKQYPKNCFNYIHLNPVNAKLVKNETDWEFSSAQDYSGLRNSKLINKEKAKEYFSINNDGII